MTMRSLRSRCGHLLRGELLLIATAGGIVTEAAGERFDQRGSKHRRICLRQTQQDGGRVPPPLWLRSNDGTRIKEQQEPVY